MGKAQTRSSIRDESTGEEAVETGQGKRSVKGKGGKGERVDQGTEGGVGRYRTRTQHNATWRGHCRKITERGNQRSHMKKRKREDTQIQMSLKKHLHNSGNPIERKTRRPHGNRDKKERRRRGGRDTKRTGLSALPHKTHHGGALAQNNVKYGK